MTALDLRAPTEPFSQWPLLPRPVDTTYGSFHTKTDDSDTPSDLSQRGSAWARPYGRDLRNAKMAYAKLRGVDLRYVWVTDTLQLVVCWPIFFANCSYADLRGATLSYADLTNAVLTGADVAEAKLPYANLTGAKLGGVNLSTAKLAYANLNSVDLRNADLSGADLSYANLRDSDLRYANLTGCKLTHVNMTGALLQTAAGEMRGPAAAVYCQPSLLD